MKFVVPIIDGVVETAPLLRAGLIDLDATFGVQLAIFITLALSMKFMAYDPFLKVASARQDATDGARSIADAAQDKAHTLGEKVDEQIAKARNEGVILRNELKLSGEKQAQDEVGRVRDELEVKTQNELAELRAAKAGAGAALSTEARRLADMIADKIVGGAS